MSLSARERNRRKILEHLGNPANDWQDRSTIATSICGYATTQGIYKIFSPDELDAIEREAIDIRRSRYARFLALVDRALLQRAAEGDPAAAKLCYQRFENWKEATKNETEVSLKVDLAARLDRARRLRQEQLENLARGKSDS